MPPTFRFLQPLRVVHSSSGQECRQNKFNNPHLSVFVHFRPIAKAMVDAAIRLFSNRSLKTRMYPDGLIEDFNCRMPAARANPTRNQRRLGLSPYQQEGRYIYFFSASSSDCAMWEPSGGGIGEVIPCLEQILFYAITVTVAFAQRSVADDRLRLLEEFLCPKSVMGLNFAHY